MINWYKIAVEELVQDFIVWSCPITHMSIRAFRINGTIEEFGLYASDGSWVDAFSTWYDANNFAKNMDKRVQISKVGKISNG